MDVEQHRQQQQHFETQAGVRPSHCWLEQCLRHVGGSNRNDEAVWNQILHADLRDVVREERNSTNDGSQTAAMQLRKAIDQSKNSIANGNANNPATNNGKYKSRKVILPSTFQLLIQMEEVVDVTMNSEQQLASMGGTSGTTTASSSATTAVTTNNRGPQQGTRNPKYRCLKMAFSDGYHSNGKPFTTTTTSSSSSEENGKENNHNQTTLMAMETSPIRHLSTTSSPPGLKLLLHGAINVRLGLLQLNDDNCTVVGGGIESWKEVWTKARERAQREKGLGVDPTIKALIWNPLMGDEEEVDEGEGESGDVTAAPPVVPPPPILQAPPPPPPEPANRSNQPMAQPNSTIHASSQNSNHNQNQSSYNTKASSSSSGGGNLRQRTLDSYPKKPRPDTTRLLPNNNASASANNNRPMAQQHHASNNPYQRSNNTNSNGRNAQSKNRPPPLQQQQQQQHPIRNNSNIIPIDDSPPSSTSQKSSTQQPQRTQSNPYASLRPPTAAAPPASATNATTTPSNTFTSNPSFSELKSILQSLRSNRSLYEQYYGKVITVPCKMDNGPSKVFNIIKAGSVEKKKGKSKKEKKYEFLLVGNFFGPKQSDGAISCRVQSSLFEGYFDGYTPAEIRKLSREDKDRANRIVNQSSTQFIHDFSSLGQFQMKLLLTADVFFEKTSSLSSSDWLADMANPFLLVIKRA
ncbi:hypothetical protein ACHAXR_004831 [Thalassiosira sp. AJA248-18]